MVKISYSYYAYMHIIMVMDMKPYQVLKVSTVKYRGTTFENFHVTLIKEGTD